MRKIYSRKNFFKKSPKVQAAIKDLKERILSKYPEAKFNVFYESPDPCDPNMILIDTIVDLEDPDEVGDFVLDRELYYQLEEKIPISVIPLRTPERVLAEMQARKMTP